MAFKKLAIGIEEIILVLLIYLNIIDFLEVIPPDLDYIKKIISWVGLGLLLYNISPIKIFFGKRNKGYDIWLIISYFLLIMKNMVTYAKVALENTNGSLKTLYEIILAKSVFFENNLIIIGFISLIIISLVLTLKQEIQPKSTLSILTETGKPPKNKLKIFIRFLSIFLVITSFFTIVFNLMMEWLAIAVDAPLLMIGLTTMFIVAIKHKHTNTKNLVYFLGNMGESFYEKFIKLFQSAKLFLGITGMLVLHSLTDIANFIIPYLFSIHDDLYFGNFKTAHISIISLLKKEFMLIPKKDAFSLFLTYFANVFIVVSLLVIPAYLWLKTYKNKKIDFHIMFHIMFYFFLPQFIFAPLFKIQRLNQGSLRGIDIITQPILKNTNYTLNSIFILSIILGLIALFLAIKAKPILNVLTFLISTSFFGYYILLYFSDIFEYYLDVIPYLFANNQILIGFFALITSTITFLFYVGGFITYFFTSLTNK